MMVSVVGVGPGNPAYLLPLARQRIEDAEVLIGGQRLLAMFSGTKGRKISLKEDIDLLSIAHRFQRVVILSGGDPLLFGVLDWVLRFLPPHEIEVIPGISSVQYMLARLKIPLKDAAVVSFHGREGDLLAVVRAHRTVVVLTDNEHTPVTIAQLLWEAGLTECVVYVGEQLSYEGESIRCFGVEELSRMENHFGLNLVVIRRCTHFSSAFPTVFSGVETFL